MGTKLQAIAIAIQTIAARNKEMWLGKGDQ